jgi:Rhodopirellula transposase DDE domain
LFAVNAVRRWWRTMGRKRHPKAKRLMVTADSGGSNGYRVRLWKVELQKLANNLKLSITDCHLPPGPASGIKSSTVYSRSLPSTGEASRCAVIGLSSN